MTRNQILAMLRRLISDEQATGFTEGGNMEEPEGTQELLNYLDRAVDEYSKRQANNKDVRLMKEISVSDNANIPDDFLSFCGCVPLNIIGKKFRFYITPEDQTEKKNVRYMARLPYVTDGKYNDDDVLPYDHDQCMAITALAAVYALNKNEANVTQDLLLLGYGVNQNVNNQQ